MQVDIKNTSIFQTTIEQIVLLKDRVTQKINFMNNELQKKKSEVNNRSAWLVKQFSDHIKNF